MRSIWLRHDLAHFKTRRRALQAKVAEDGIILTQAQVQALEKKKLDNEAWGEIDTAHPGYPGSQDTFYVGPLKGVGRIYQQTYVDAYAKIAHAKLYHQDPDHGVKALAMDPHLTAGLNVRSGKVTYQAVAETLGYDYVAPKALF